MDYCKNKFNILNVFFCNQEVLLICFHASDPVNAETLSTICLSIPYIFSVVVKMFDKTHMRL